MWGAGRFGLPFSLSHLCVIFAFDLHEIDTEARNRSGSFAHSIWKFRGVGEHYDLTVEMVEQWRRHRVAACGYARAWEATGNEVETARKHRQDRAKWAKSKKKTKKSTESEHKMLHSDASGLGLYESVRLWVIHNSSQCTWTMLHAHRINARNGRSHSAHDTHQRQYFATPKKHVGFSALCTFRTIFQ